MKLKKSILIIFFIFLNSNSTFTADIIETPQKCGKHSQWQSLPNEIFLIPLQYLLSCLPWDNAFKIAESLSILLKNTKIRHIQGLAGIDLRFADINFIIDALRSLNINLSITNYPYSQGSTALHVATNCGWIRVVRFLVEAGLDVNLPNHLHHTPLHLAAMFGRITISDLLLEKGAFVNALDYWDMTPLHYAAEKNDIITEILITRGANINAINRNGATPLHYASRKGNEKTIRALIRLGADKTIRNINGDTPEQLARNQGYHELADLIRDWSPKGKMTREDYCCIS